MSESSLISYKDLRTPHRSDGRNGEKISRITIHHAAGVVSLESLSNITMNKEASYNYGVSSDAKIGLYVSEANRAWTSSSGENDRKAVTIEVSNSSNGDPWPVSDKVLNAVLCLCEDICRRNDIPKLIYDPVGKQATSNLTMHKWFTPTVCPGPYLESKFPTIAATVNKRLKIPGGSPELNAAKQGAIGSELNVVTVDPVTSDSTGMYTTSYTRAEDMINTEALTPFIITLDENSPKDVDWQVLKDQQVSGVMIEAGSYYNTIHQPQGLIGYRNKHLRQQIIDSMKNGFPFGLIHPIKARKISECNGELDALRQVVRLYAPQLGVWLRINFSGSIAQNDSILNTYYDFLTKHVGLKNNLGIVATRDQIDKISWEDKFSDKFLLWLDDKVDSLNNLSELMTPSFFNVVD